LKNKKTKPQAVSRPPRIAMPSTMPSDMPSTMPSPMKKPAPIPFRCHHCDAEYRIFTVESPLVGKSRSACLCCDTPLPGSEGNVVLKYCLVKRTGSKR
jgi:hypothetical protein